MKDEIWENDIKYKQSVSSVKWNVCSQLSYFSNPFKYSFNKKTKKNRKN